VGLITAEIDAVAIGSLSDEAWQLLHELRLKGFRPAKGGPVEEEVTEAGLVIRRGANLALAPAGRQAHARSARLPFGSEEETLAKQTYERFLTLNVEFL
jgi:hypothetical protein